MGVCGFCFVCVHVGVCIFVDDRVNELKCGPKFTVVHYSGSLQNHTLTPHSEPLHLVNVDCNIMPFLAAYHRNVLKETISGLPNTNRSHLHLSSWVYIAKRAVCGMHLVRCSQMLLASPCSGLIDLHALQFNWEEKVHNYKGHKIPVFQASLIYKNSASTHKFKNISN